MGSCISFCPDQASPVWMGQCRSRQAGQVVFRVLPVAAWIAVSRSVGVSVALLALLCCGALLLRAPAKTSALVTVVLVLQFLTHVGKLLLQTRSRYAGRSLSFPDWLPKCLLAAWTTRNMLHRCLLQSSLSSFSAASSPQDVLCSVRMLSLYFPLL